MSSAVQIQDKYFVLAWSLSDEKKIERYTAALKQMYGKPEFDQLYNNMADTMISLVGKKHNDHHNATTELLGHDWLRVEPLNQPYFQEDMVTFQGLNKLLKIYTAAASGVFKYMAYGTASATPTPYTTALNAESGTRQDCTTTGFQSVSGSSLRLLSSYASTIASVTIYQCGIFDASTTGNLLAIHDFGAANGYAHTINVNAFSLGIVIDFVPFGEV